jgi:hypothetical protein
MFSAAEQILWLQALPPALSVLQGDTAFWVMRAYQRHISHAQLLHHFTSELSLGAKDLKLPYYCIEQYGRENAVKLHTSLSDFLGRAGHTMFGFD